MGATLYSSLLTCVTAHPILASFMMWRYNCRHLAPPQSFCLRLPGCGHSSAETIKGSMPLFSSPLHANICTDLFYFTLPAVLLLPLLYDSFVCSASRHVRNPILLLIRHVRNDPALQSSQHVPSHNRKHHYLQLANQYRISGSSHKPSVSQIEFC